MDIGYLTTDAIKYPSGDLRKVVILGILILFSFLIVPAFLVWGYAFRSLKWSIADVDELPDFDEWGDMLLDGLKVFLVQLAYFIIPLIMVLAGVFASIDSILALQTSGNTLFPTAAFSLMSGLFIFGLIFFIIFGVFFIIGLANMAYNDGKISAAFKFKEILDIISAIGWVDYIIWYIMMIIVGCGVGFLAIILGLIPILGWALMILVLYPYLYLLYARALGLLFVSGFENIS